MHRGDPSFEFRVDQTHFATHCEGAVVRDADVELDQFSGSPVAGVSGLFIRLEN